MYMTIGISGSGKGYYLKNRFLSDFKEVAEYLSANRLSLSDITVSPDDIRREVCGNVSDISRDSYVWKLADSRLKSVLEDYGYGVFDATGVSKNGRTKFLKNYKGVGTTVSDSSYIYKTAIVFEPNVSLSKERIKEDLLKGVDRSKVPMFVIDRQFESFKSSVMCDEKWDGLWNTPSKKKIMENLKDEFDEVICV